MALFGGRSHAELTLTDAIMTGFRMVTQRDFVIPILVIGAVINLIVIAAIVPIVISIALPSSNALLIGGAIISGILGALIAGILGGLLLNLYGQVWATMASAGEAPTMQQAFAQVGTRWMSILGAGLIVGAVTLGIVVAGLLVAGILGVALGALGLLALLVVIVAAIYVGARLSLAGWLAADGVAALDAVRGSWELSGGQLTTIIVWNVAFGIVFGIVGGILGAILGIIPLIGPALAQTATTAFGFGAGVALYRKVKAS
jgi:hypothetical protein